MFLASLLICWMDVAGEQCLIAEDNRGLKPTVQECTERLEEMAADILRDMPWMTIKATNCVPVKNERAV